MKELVFSINDIFDSETQTGCLSQYSADGYHIPVYQHGYKWGENTHDVLAQSRD